MNELRTTISSDIYKHMKQLELHTRRLLKHTMIGQTRSALKGAGFDFDQIRDYQMGDDVRFIDWKASARSNKMLVKQYRQERGRIIIVALDISASARMGSDAYHKAMIQADLASVLAFAGAHADDAVGLVLFSDRIEQYLPPRRNRHAGRLIMETIFSARPQGAKTDMAILFKHLAALGKKDAMLVIVSDFIECQGQEQFGLMGRLYDTIAIRCLMPQERALPITGFLNLSDAESGAQCLIDARRHNRVRINNFLQQRIADQDRLFARAGIDLFDVTTSVDYVPALVTFFYQRMLVR